MYKLYQKLKVRNQTITLGFHQEEIKQNLTKLLSAANLICFYFIWEVLEETCFYLTFSLIILAYICFILFIELRIKSSWNDR